MAARHPLDRPVHSRPSNLVASINRTRSFGTRLGVGYTIICVLLPALDGFMNWQQVRRKRPPTPP